MTDDEMIQALGIDERLVIELLAVAIRESYYLACAQLEARAREKMSEVPGDLIARFVADSLLACFVAAIATHALTFGVDIDELLRTVDEQVRSTVAAEIRERGN